MHSGEVLKRKIDCLNKARRLIQEAETEFTCMDGENNFSFWRAPMRRLLTKLWQARRLMKKAAKYDRKYHKMMKESN